MNTNRWLDGLSIVYGRYIGLGINYWPDPNNRNANERSMSQSSDIARKGGFLQRPSIINWDLFVFECNATGRKHVYLSSFGTWMSGWWNLWKTFASTTREIPSIWQSQRWQRGSGKITDQSWQLTQEWKVRFYLLCVCGVHSTHGCTQVDPPSVHR